MSMQLTRSQLVRWVVAILALVASVRLASMMGEETPSRPELVVYYVLFFWLLAFTGAEIFRGGFSGVAPRAATLVFSICGLMIAGVYVWERSRALDQYLFDRRDSFFALLAIAYLGLGAVAVTGTNALRERWRRWKRTGA
jgi:hypothetical protein